MSPPTYPPTARQLDLLRWIAGYQLAHGGISPTYDELTAGLGLNCKSGVHRMLEGLEERGMVRRLRGRARAIKLLVEVPVPRAPAGAPLFFVPVDDFGRPASPPTSRGGHHAA